MARHLIAREHYVDLIEDLQALVEDTEDEHIADVLHELLERHPVPTPTLSLVEVTEDTLSTRKMPDQRRAKAQGGKKKSSKASDKVAAN